MADRTDARGTSLRNFAKPCTRIVSLVPSQTELLHHLGLQDEVIGITKFCVHPQHWFRTKTRVGGTKNVTIEKIKSLQPDLILANKEENVQEQIEALAAFAPVWVTDVATLNDAVAMIADVGALTGKTEAAARLNTNILQAFQQLQHELPPTPLRTCYLIWNDPYLTVGGDTFIHAMLQQARFENLFAEAKRYPEITLNMLRENACELLLLSSEPYPFSQKHIAAIQPLLPDTKIVLVDGELFSWYGSRLQWAPDYFKSLHAQLTRVKQ